MKQKSPPPLIALFCFLALVLNSSYPANGQNALCSAPADYLISSNQNLSTLFPNSSGVTGKTFEIQNGITLTIDKTFLFANCKFRCGDGSAIVTSASAIAFNAASCQFATCGNFLWKGVTINPNARIAFQNCWLKDAETAIHFPAGYSGANNSLRNNTFENNYYGLYLGNPLNTAGAVVGFTYCYNNIFYQTGSDLKGNTYTRSHSGVYLDIKSMIAFGTDGGFNNQFVNMGYGMYLKKNAHAIVANSSFRFMIDAFSSDGNDGSGIYAGSATLTVTEVNEKGCNFNNNFHAGVRTSNLTGSNTIKHASFFGDQRHGIRSVTNNLVCTINYSNNHFSLRKAPSVLAIYLDRPPGMQGGSVPSIIERDTIIVPQLAGGTPTLGALIDIRGNTGASDPLQIAYNQITNFCDDDDMYGIFTRGAGNNCQITFNQVGFIGSGDLLDGEDFDNFGIAAEDMNGEGNSISNNIITSVLQQGDTQDPEVLDMSFIKCGIHVANCQHPVICANTLNNTHRGFHLAQMLPNCVLGENQMYRHVHPLHCSNGLGVTGSNLTDIGDQVHAGNVWAAAGSADVFPIGVAARYVDNNTVPFKFYVDETPLPPLPSGRTYLPPSGIPSILTWFVPQDGVVTGCTVVLPEFSKSEHEIALGIYPYGNDAEAWDQQRQLWYKMLRHPDWVASNDTIKNFHDATWGTSAQRFAAVQWQFEQAFSPESNLSATLLSLYEDYNSVVSDIVSLEEIISADTTTLNTGHVATLQNALNDWAEIAGDWTEASHTYAVERDNKLDAVKDSLLVLPDNEPWEQAWIAMLEVAVGRGKAAEGEEMTETDRESLASIAEACPEYVGLARRIVITYMTPEDGLIYMGKENTEGCTAYGVQRVAKNVYDWEDIEITPNPANQYLRIQLPAAQRAHWAILSTTGHLLLHGDWQEDVKEQFISLGQLPGGSYILRIQRGSGEIQSARFSVIK